MRGIEGRSTLVTGAADGMGAAAARRLGAEGARLVLLDIDAEKLDALATEIGGDAIPVVGDVSVEADVDRAAAAAEESFGGIDLAFLNAGVTGAVGMVDELTIDGWDRTLAVNLRGCFLTMRAAARSLLAREQSGSIVATASMLSLQGGPGIAPYVASKHAIVGLVRTAALEYGARGIRVNALCPGYIDTRMVRVFEEGQDDPAAAHEAMVAKNAFGRYGTPDEVANMGAWLLSDEASYCSGACFSVDGAITAGEALAS
jgi:NAD(P)-dependent dehydrogenase (short-subunit alcohol dehydrogenase family)